MKKCYNKKCPEYNKIQVNRCKKWHPFGMEIVCPSYLSEQANQIILLTAERDAFQRLLKKKRAGLNSTDALNAKLAFDLDLHKKAIAFAVDKFLSLVPSKLKYEGVIEHTIKDCLRLAGDFERALNTLPNNTNATREDKNE